MRVVHSHGKAQMPSSIAIDRCTPHLGGTKVKDRSLIAVCMSRMTARDIKSTNSRVCRYRVRRLVRLAKLAETGFLGQQEISPLSQDVRLQARAGDEIEETAWRLDSQVCALHLTWLAFHHQRHGHAEEVCAFVVVFVMTGAVLRLFCSANSRPDAGLPPKVLE
jgi:hypothetical protein